MTPTSDQSRFTLAVVGIGLCFAAAGFTQAGIQVFDRQKTLDLAASRGRYVVVKSQLPKRGTIFTADGRAIAQSQDAFELGLDYRKIPLSPGFFMELAQATGFSEAELSLPASEGAKARNWPEPLGDEQSKLVRQVRTRWKADGVSLTPVPGRTYPLDEYTSGLVGMLRNGIATNGFEKSLNSKLTGRRASSRGFYDRTGTFIPDNPNLSGSSNGENVTLTIDSSLQIAATQAVRAAVEKHKATSGCAIVIDPRTGDILAMANWPTFNPDRAILPGQDTNSSYMSVLEPGSTFKILTLAEALDSGAIDRNFTVQCKGELEVVGGRTVKCDDHHGNRAHGVVTLEQAIAKSCNVSAATWALKIGRAPFIDFMKKVGVLDKPNLGLPSEVKGKFNYKDGSPRLQLANLGFGQAMNLVPVSLASAFSIIANDGVRMKPRLIKSIGDHEVPIQSLGPVVKKNVANHVLHLMESVIESDFGTGASLRVPGYRLAGKTGTAQKVGRAGAKGYVANFVGIVPSTHPRALVLVMIDNPHAGYYGAAVAGPVFTDLARAIIRRYDIPRDVTPEVPILSNDLIISNPNGPLDLEISQSDNDPQFTNPQKPSILLPSPKNKKAKSNHPATHAAK